MKKEQRDKILGRMGPSQRNDLRSLIKQARTERKASSSKHFTAREVLEPLKSGLAPELQSGLDATIARSERGPQVGEQPPNFNLKLMGSERRVRLSSFRGNRPVALVFGSYT
jgi:hypothetical protein